MFRALPSNFLLNALSSSFPNALPPLQRTFTRSTHRVLLSLTENFLTRVPTLKYCYVLVTRQGFGMVITFTGLLNLANTKNYSIIANSHTLNITITLTKSSMSFFTSGCLVTDPNNVLFCSCPWRLATVSHLTHGYMCPPYILDCLPRLTNFRVRVTLRLAVYRNQFILAPSPLRLTTRFFFTTEPLRS
jgi:hypothetical protein